MKKKIVAIIPARYQSTRFEGKPLADINGKPMIWWTYNQVIKAKGIDEVYVATDSEKIKEACEELAINVVLTTDRPKMMLERVQEVSNQIKADLYISIAGDEPLIEPENIEKIIEEYKISDEGYQVFNLRTPIKNPVDVINNTIMKVVTDTNHCALFASRSPIPYPKANVDYIYYKHMGTYALTKKALDFFVTHEKAELEKIEDFDLLRFLEYGMAVKIIDVNSQTVSVDTPKDLERVKKAIGGG